MKYKTTKKDMKSNYDKIIGIGYCNAQFLLKFEEPTAYSARAEGWACDYYDVDGVLISTGYAPLDSKNAKRDYDMIRKYDQAAEKIACDYNLKYEEQKEQVNTLLKEFVREARM